MIKRLETSRGPNWLFRTGAALTAVGSLALFGSFGLGMRESHKVKSNIKDLQEIIDTNPFLDKVGKIKLTPDQQAVEDRVEDIEDTVLDQLKTEEDLLGWEFAGLGVATVGGLMMLGSRKRKDEQVITGFEVYK